MKNVLTKALGAREDVEFDVVSRPLQPGDVLLLCSDGLTNMLSDAAILEIGPAPRAGPRGRRAASSSPRRTRRAGATTSARSSCATAADRAAPGTIAAVRRA